MPWAVISTRSRPRSTPFHARVPAWELDFGLNTLLDVLVDPGFTETELRRRTSGDSRRAAERRYADDVVHGVLAESLFPGHPLGWEVLGTADTVQAIDAAQVRAFHDRWYRRSNMVIAVVGPVDHDEIVARVDTALAVVGEGERPVRAAPPPEIVPEVVTPFDRADAPRPGMAHRWPAQP